MSLSLAVDALERFYGVLPPPPRDAFALYVWEVMGAFTIPLKRDAALAALKRIPALTPDSVWKAPRAKIEAALALAGPRREERTRALMTGVELFRRHTDVAERLRRSLVAGRRALRLLPYLGEAGRHRMLLFAGGYAIVPLDPAVARVVVRLGIAPPCARPRRALRGVHQVMTGEFGADAAAIRRATLYLDHHAMVTCGEREVHCQVCPLHDDCREGQRRTDLGSNEQRAMSNEERVTRNE
jgi:endonuclease III